MKKAIVFAILFALGASQASVYALSPEEEKKARYQEMKKIKDAQRAAREAEKTNPQAQGPKEKSFWEKEGERSGLSGNSSRFSGWFKNLNPVPFFKEQDQRYKDRKAQAPPQGATIK